MVDILGTATAIYQKPLTAIGLKDYSLNEKRFHLSTTKSCCHLLAVMSLTIVSIGDSEPMRSTEHRSVRGVGYFKRDSFPCEIYIWLQEIILGVSAHINVRAFPEGHAGGFVER